MSDALGSGRSSMPLLVLGLLMLAMAWGLYASGLATDILRYQKEICSQIFLWFSNKRVYSSFIKNGYIVSARRFYDLSKSSMKLSRYVLIVASYEPWKYLGTSKVSTARYDEISMLWEV